MAGHLTPIAVRIKAALESGAALREAVDEAYADPAVGDSPVYVDTGAREAVFFLPGYGPLSDPAEYVHVAREVA